MATSIFAMWLQEPDMGTRHLVMLFIGLIAVAVLVLTIALVSVAIKASRAVKDLTAAAGEFKDKMLPLLDEMMEISKTGRTLLQDAAPKVKAITDNLAKASDTLAETSNAARLAVERCDATIADVNMRAQRQVARMDGILTVALTATAEVVETVAHGIRVPVQKVAAIAGQAKYVAEGLLAKIRSVAARTPFGSGNRPAD